MTHSRLLKTLLLSTTLFASACALDPGDSDQSDPSADSTLVHIMPLHNPDAAAPQVTAAAIAGLTYFGGPILTHVSVHPVFWNSATKLQANINAFYPAVVGSSSAMYTSVLTQYNIGTGTSVAGITDTNSTRSIKDSAIQNRLKTLIGQGSLPAPNANTYYPVHFPSGMTISLGSSRSCVQFCAYHSTFVLNGVNVNYGVIPDIGQSGCNGGCGGSTVTNNTDSVASHELVEATTDPAVGLATVFGPPLGWYDQPDNQEIGDLCNAQQGTAAGFTIQKEWSNSANACVDH
jgi:hypothetical protein